ncbi:MFS transporter [Mesorhizobium sp. C416B]|uniref:MFS transporter n=1 Tax=unclassified Mesorhizobium TaxID=325217 RepID=UPI0003CE18BB|nr:MULTISPECIES: MFS transporter [unclassified Mesorhizobium]ESX56663.1 ABC transporter permease [Mesorhizobium sp. LSHC424B00]WJI61351.1 MFS transporter [Mesorhizobium sp. C416B]
MPSSFAAQRPTDALSDRKARFALLPSGAGPAAAYLLASRGLRAFGDGLVSLLLPAYLATLGFNALEIGGVATATLAGSAALTLSVGLVAHHFSRRSLLIAASVLMVGTGIAFALVTDFWPLLVVALVGTLNPSSGDVSVFLPLEHAQLAHSVTDRDRTALFARYSLVGSLVGAVGALAAGAPDLLRQLLGLEIKQVLQIAFLLYAFLGLGALLIYWRLPVEPLDERGAPAEPLRKSRAIVLTLAALFSVDAFAGGFVVQSLLALWLYQRFGLSLATTGAIFFCTGVLSAISYLVAVQISKRIGLVNTMVFTHLPSSLCLLLIPFMPTLGPVIVLLLIRSALSQMDVPTRTSYVMAVVTPGERAAAASVTAVPRSLAAAASPVIAGSLLAISGFGWPLLIAGALKIIYDILLLTMFRKVRPPEERRDG